MAIKNIFFFQAEDGIRDLPVTGVQTCALPIFWFLFCSLLFRCFFTLSRLFSLFSFWLHFSIFFLFLFVLLVVVVAAAIGWGFDRFSAPGPLATKKTVILPTGIGVNEIAHSLSEGGVIEQPLLFRIGVRVSGNSRELRAGEYVFAAAISPKEVMELLVSGRTVVRRVRVPEVLTSA